MRRKTTALGMLFVSVMAISGVVVMTGSPAGAAASTLVASWQMNEPVGATVMTDSSGHGNTGAIGSKIQTGSVTSGATGYKWSFKKPNALPVEPDRLVTVNAAALNPGIRDYAVTLRYRTTQSFGNVIQKGQNGSKGGYFKFEQPSGFMTCLFKDGNGGQRAVKSKIATNDGAWHTIRCERTQAGLTMTVDGATKYMLGGATGSISNSVPLTIGGKLNCDQIATTCDYFTGQIDWVTIEAS